MEFSFSPPLDLEMGKKRKERVAFEETHPQSITVGLIAAGCEHNVFFDGWLAL